MTKKEKILKDIKEGDVIFINRTSYGKWYSNIIPKLICYFTGAKYHHVAIVKKNNDASLVVIEAVMKGFIVTSTIEDYIERAGQEYDLLIVSRGDYLKNLNFKLLLLEGNPYDFGSLFFWQLINKTFKKLFNKPLWLGRKGTNALTTLYCSEAIAFIYELDEWWKVGPKELLDYFRNKDYKFYRLY